MSSTNLSARAKDTLVQIMQGPTAEQREVLVAAGIDPDASCDPESTEAQKRFDILHPPIAGDKQRVCIVFNGWAYEGKIEKIETLPLTLLRHSFLREIFPDGRIYYVETPEGLKYGGCKSVTPLPQHEMLIKDMN